jgi:WD40 repeat protein
MPGHGDKMRSLVVATDGTIASGDFSGEIRLWDGGSGTGTGGSGSGTNGSEAGTGGQAGAFRKTLARQGTMVGSLSFSPDGKTLLSSCGQNCRGTYGFVYDLASGRGIVRYFGHDNIVLATAISPDGRWATTGGFHGEIHLSPQVPALREFCGDEW